MFPFTASPLRLCPSVFTAVLTGVVEPLSSPTDWPTRGKPGYSRATEPDTGAPGSGKCRSLNYFLTISGNACERRD